MNDCLSNQPLPSPLRKRKKKLPSRSVLNASGGEKLFLSCSPQTMRLEFNIQVPIPVVDGVLSLLTSRNSDW